MRTILITLMLLLSLAACGTKTDAPEMAADGTPQAETPQAESAADAVASDAAQGEESAAKAVAEADKAVQPDVEEEEYNGPFGEVRLADGTAIEIARLEKISKYYIYIIGKLNGRSSTVISLTRLSDLQAWGSIIFEGPRQFTIVTKTNKEWHFADSDLYFGNGTPLTYSFFTTNPNTLALDHVEVKKQNVKSIEIR